MQRDKIDMQFELQRFKQSTEATLIMREKKIKMLEEGMQSSEMANKSVIQGYEKRIERM